MIDVIAAEMLLKLVIEHKTNCKTSECGISLFPLRAVYRELINRELTPEERAKFL